MLQHRFMWNDGMMRQFKLKRVSSMRHKTFFFLNLVRQIPSNLTYG